MLSARKIQPTCFSPGWHRILQYESSFLATRSLIFKISRYNSLICQSKRVNSACSISFIRKFNSTSRNLEYAKSSPPTSELPDETSQRLIEDQVTLPDSIDKDSEIETIVRQAKQTFGDTLPKDYLSTEEYKVYERLFGSPIRETTAEDLEYVPNDENTSSQQNHAVLLQEDEDGKLEEVYCDSTVGVSIHDFPGSKNPNDTDLNRGNEKEYTEDVNIKENGRIDFSPPNRDITQIEFVARNQRELNVMIKLQKDMKAVVRNPENERKAEQQEILDEIEEEEEEEEYQEEDNQDLYISSDTVRTHPHTIAGRSRSNPSTIYLPNEKLVAPITEMLSRTKPVHLKLAAEMALGGEGLPFSVSAPNSMKHMPQKEIGLDASQHRMSEIQADVYLSTILPGSYASILSILVEVRKRLGQTWLRDLMLREGGVGPKVLDAGAGGAGILAWRKIMEAEWDTMNDEGIVHDKFTSLGKNSVVTGSDSLRDRVSKLLDNTTFLPRLPDYVHTTPDDRNIDEGCGNGRKIFDVVMAPYTLLSQKETYKRKHLIKNLWTLVNPQGGILIFVEKGIPRGFETIAEARSFILKSYIASPDNSIIENNIESLEFDQDPSIKKEDGMIIAPCTNHSKCPMYLNPGISQGRKDFCHFPQRFIRPHFLQKLLKAKSRNHEDIKFSYVVFRRGIDERKSIDKFLTGDEATEKSFGGYEFDDLPESHQGEDYVKSDVSFNTYSLPRVILSPLKRHGHVILDLCTPSGQLERWTVPKSFSKAAYRDARKSKWGDLWALGAKTRVPKNIRLGRVIVAHTREAESYNGKKVVKKYDVLIGKDGFEGFKRSGKTFVDRHEKRTKGGRLSKCPQHLGVNDL